MRHVAVATDGSAVLSAPPLRLSAFSQEELIQNVFPEFLLPDFIEFGELNLPQLTWRRSKLRFAYRSRTARLQSKSAQMTEISENVQFQKQTEN